MKVVYVGQFVSIEESLLDKRISQAGNNYQLKFIELLKPQLAISVIPIFLRKLHYKDKGFQSNTVVINNFSFLPNKIHNIYRLIADSIKVLYVLKRSKINNVFYYNINKHNFLMIFLTKYLLRKKTFIVIADHSSFQNKSLFDKFSNSVLSKLDGAIVFNSNIKVNKRQHVLPGLLRENQIKKPSGVQTLNKNIMLSGSIGKTTGLEVALDALSKRPDYNLFITGRPYKYTEEEFTNLINYYSKKFNNIKYLGLLDYDEYISLLNQCDITFSLRDPNDEEHQYNFPSKILEYLSMSKLVISSIAYKDIPSNFLFLTDFESNKLLMTLDYMYDLDPNSIYNLKMKIFEYLNENFTDKALIRICKQLIEL